MKHILFFMCFLFAPTVFAQTHSGVVVAEQRPEGLAFHGGLYFTSGLLVQAQYLNQSGNWLVVGKSFDWIEFNTGPAFGKNTGSLTHWSFQANVTLGTDTNMINILALNEYDHGLDGSESFVWGFHQYLHRGVSPKLFLGPTIEFQITFKEPKTEYQLLVGPMLKFWITPEWAVTLAHRSKMQSTEFDITHLRHDHIYFSLFHSFKFK